MLAFDNRKREAIASQLPFTGYHEGLLEADTRRSHEVHEGEEGIKPSR